MGFDITSVFGGKGFQDRSGYMDRPPMNIPDEEKDENYHKQYLLNIVRGSVNEQWTHGYTAINENYKFYDGTQGGDEFRFLQEAEDGDILPASWINFNKIRVKIDLLLGELSKKGFDINVNAINKDAVSKKLAEKERSRVEMRLAGDRQMLEQQFGMPLSTGKFVPESEAELDEYYSYQYKTNSEKIMKRALKYVAKYNDWDYTRIALFRDVLIAGRAFVRVEVRGGVPWIKRIDPRLMIFDPNCEDDLLRDSTYYGEIAYESLADAVSKYNISKEELNAIYKANQSPTGGIQGGQYVNTNLLLGKNNISLFKEERGDLRTLVIRAAWQDVKYITHKMSVDSFGNKHYKKISADEESTFYGAEKRRDSYQIWRRGTLIAGNILREWGEMENMGRDIDNPYHSTPPYIGVAPNYVNYRTVSKVEQLKGLQKLKDITMFNIQLTMSRAGGKGFIYDLAQMPDGWDTATVLKYLKAVGIGFIDSKKDGMPANFNQFQTVDMTISSSVDQYLKISQMVDMEMDAISGINEARQGIVQSASQAVGVTQSSLLQSNLATETLFSIFEMFNTRIYNNVAKLVKLVWPENEHFAMIVGDDGLNWMEEDSDLDLQDYGVFVEFIPPSIADLQTFQGMVQMGIQAGMIDFLSGIKLLREKDVDYGISQLERQLERQQIEQLKQQQAQQQAEEEAAMAQQAQQLQAQNQMKDKEMAGKMALEEIKGANQIQSQSLNGIMNKG